MVIAVPVAAIPTCIKRLQIKVNYLEICRIIDLKSAYHYSEFIPRDRFIS